MFLLLDTIVAGWRRRVVFYRETGLGAARLGGDTSHKLIPVRKLPVETRHVQHRGFRKETYYRLSRVSLSTTVQYSADPFLSCGNHVRISWSAPKRTAQHTRIDNKSKSNGDVSFYIHNQFCTNITTYMYMWICKRTSRLQWWLNCNFCYCYVAMCYTLLLNLVLRWKFLY